MYKIHLVPVPVPTLAQLFLSLTRERAHAQKPLSPGKVTTQLLKRPLIIQMPMGDTSSGKYITLIENIDQLERAFLFNL